MKKAFIFIFTGLGLVLTFLLIIGATNDFASFDRTKGGYERLMKDTPANLLIGMKAI